MTALCFLDTETTGLHPARRVWEFGCVLRRPAAPQAEYQFFVDVDLDEADPAGLAVGGFYERHPVGRWLSGRVEHRPRPAWFSGPVNGALLSETQAAQVAARVTHGAVVVGAVPSFDTVSLDWLLREHGHLPQWHYHLVDVENLAVGYLARHREEITGSTLFDRMLTPPWSSTELAEALGVTIDDEDRHTALGDARWAMALYDAVMGGTAGWVPGPAQLEPAGATP
jgi:hypothetical protein